MALELGIDPNSKDWNGNSIVILGAQNNNKSVVKHALWYGGDIDMTNNKGNTALHYCYEFKYLDLGKYLESKGADKTLKNAYGFLPFERIWAKRDYFSLD